MPLGIDGVSIAPTLTGAGIQGQREVIIHEAGRNHAREAHDDYKSQIDQG